MNEEIKIMHTMEGIVFSGNLDWVRHTSKNDTIKEFIRWLDKLEEMK